ncbi:hypothetical protein DFP94_103387 [Fontibacillus phaseoli]|uniref:Surface layer protein bacterial Ig-like domain-containing protein n=1 Tax=Fontibacillus phaseoli TaxID=1416533 RepID=A0A369BHB1_9BACL|nr:hypothetical protein [Fontibacillus phaseoli]RCX20655.1 hypothetical protein DFP94_103387 [Fontibacillus phaseoli]
MLKQLSKLVVLSLTCILIWSGGAGHGIAATASDPEVSGPATEWSALYGTNAASSNGRSVIPTTDGGYIAVGEVVDLNSSGYAAEQKIYVVKVNENGGITWEKKLLIGADSGKAGGSAYNAIQTRDGGYLVSGAVTDYSGKPLRVPFLAKLDSQGTLEWEKNYDTLSPSTDLYGESIAESTDGGFVITGFSANSYALASAYVLKVDGTGNEVWFKTFRFGDDNQYFNALIASPDGGYVAVGTIESMLSSEQDASVIVKLNDLGEVEWEKRQPLPGSNRSAHSVQLSPDGAYLVNGMQQQGNEQQAYVTKIDAEGETLWGKTYNLGYDNNDYMTQLLPTEDGYALLGYHAYGSYPDHRMEYQIITLNSDWEMVTKRPFKDYNLAGVGKGTVASDDGFVLTGQIKENDSYRMQVIKVSGNDLGSPTDPEITELRFDTAEGAELSIGELRPSVINAVYADGTFTDVTAVASFASLNPEIASVDASGVITGLSVGGTVITAGYGGFEAQLNVRVTDGPSGPLPITGKYYLDSEDYSLSIGSELDIQAWFEDKDGNTRLVNGETEFTVTNPDVALINQEGIITGIGQGLTSVTAVYQGRTYTASVLVVRPYIPAGVDDETLSDSH